MVARKFSNIAVSTTLSSGITAGATTLTVVSATGWPAAPFILVIEPDLANEELILVGAKSGEVFSSLTRGFGGTSGVAHNAADVIKHVTVAEDHSLVTTHTHVPSTDDTAQLSHDDLSGVSVDDHHDQVHTVVSHSDTTATGAELEILTDNSNADPLHFHDHGGLASLGPDNHHAQLHQASHRPGGNDSLDLGVLGYAEVTASQSSITTEVDLTGLSIAITVGSSRRILITGHVAIDRTVSDGLNRLRIKEGATVLVLRDMPVRGASEGAIELTTIVSKTPSSGPHTYKLSLERTTGTGTIGIIAAATFPSFILVEDIGPA